jgi:pimeloyl-ACP methyl ester carboxylesterase
MGKTARDGPRCRASVGAHSLENGAQRTPRVLLLSIIKFTIEFTRNLTDLPKTACDINTAFFVIQGQDDVIATTLAAVDYFKCVKAPKKELIFIRNAGHFA